MRLCPKCGASDYTTGFTLTTAVYYPPVFVDGVNINPDRNSSKQIRHCNKCRQDTTVELNSFLANGEGYGMDLQNNK